MTDQKTVEETHRLRIDRVIQQAKGEFKVEISIDPIFKCGWRHRVVPSQRVEFVADQFKNYVAVAVDHREGWCLDCEAVVTEIKL